MNDFYRGDLVLADLEPKIGSEQRGRSRPCLIVSSNSTNSTLPVIIVCPLTSKIRKTFVIGPVLIAEGTAGLKETSLVLVMQIRTIDKSRVSLKLGSVPTEIMEKVSDSLMSVLDLD